MSAGPEGFTSLEPLETSHTPLRAWTEPQKRLHGRHATQRRYIISALLSDTEGDLLARAERMQECCAFPLVGLKGGKSACVVLGLCRDRMCPRCAAGRGRVAAEKIEKVVQTFNAARFATLTLRHRAGESLVEMLKRLAAAFRLLRTGERWKRRVKGGVWAVEVTRNTQAETWHAHLHLIVDGGYYKQAELSLDWECATKDSRIVDIRAVNDRRSVAKYISTYIAKPHAVEGWTPAEICEYARAMAGKRLIHTFGCAHGKQVDPSPAEEPKVSIEPVCSTARLAHLSMNGHAAAAEARTLLARCGGLLGGLFSDAGFAGRPALPPLDSNECTRLVELLREVANTPHDYDHKSVSAAMRRDRVKRAKRAQREIVFVPTSAVVFHDGRA